ncbi:MAG: hypothetical protein RSB94_07830 [Erysipelotrichaceae bacterium]
MEGVYYALGAGVLLVLLLWLREIFNDKRLIEKQENCKHEYFKDESYSYKLYSEDLSTSALHTKYTCIKCGLYKYHKLDIN